jgi:hypothetical protein
MPTFKEFLGTGWDVVWLVDALGQPIEDSSVLAYSTYCGRVWLTSDARAKGHVTTWLEQGETRRRAGPPTASHLPASLCAPPPRMLPRRHPSAS